MKKFVTLFLALAGLVGCKRDDLIVNIRLGDNETISANAPVMLGDERAGAVVSVLQQGSQRVARLAIRADFSPALRQGTSVASVSSSGIELDDISVLPDANKLDQGAWLPRRKAEGKAAVAKIVNEKLPWLGRHGLNPNTIMGLAVAAILVLWLLRDSLFAGSMALLSAWLLHPFLLPRMAGALAKARANQASISGVDSSLDPGSAAAALERTLTDTLSQLPGPTVLAIGVVFLCTYMGIRFFQKCLS